MVRIRLAIAVAIVAGLMAPFAMAGSGAEGYRGEGGRVQSDLQVRGAQTEETLPFTGLELGLFAVGGALLIGGGVGLHRVARKKS